MILMKGQKFKKQTEEEIDRKRKIERQKDSIFRRKKTKKREIEREKV